MYIVPLGERYNSLKTAPWRLKASSTACLSTSFKAPGCPSEENRIRPPGGDQEHIRITAVGALEFQTLLEVLFLAVRVGHLRPPFDDPHAEGASRRHRYVGQTLLPPLADLVGFEPGDGFDVEVSLPPDPVGLEAVKEKTARDESEG